VTRERELYLQMDIYMNLPKPTNLLGYSLTALGLDKETDLFRVLHARTEVGIVTLADCSWLRLRFQDAAEALAARRRLSVLTYRFYFNGFFLRLFNQGEVGRQQEVKDYERKVQALFGIGVGRTEGSERARSVEVDNRGSSFVWPFVEEGFAPMFGGEQVRALPISVFIYNKNRRPLKVNCELLWVLSESLYYFRRAGSGIRVGTPREEERLGEGNLPMMAYMRHRLHRARQFSMKQHKSLLQANRQRGHSELVRLSLLSETLNIKRQ
jgi:hypothetical protein